MARRRTLPGPHTAARRDLIKQLLAEREETGESYRSLEERSGIPAPTLASWRRRLRLEGEDQGGEEVQLVEIEPASLLTASRPIEIEFTAGVIIRIPSGFEADAVGKILDLVMERC